MSDPITAETLAEFRQYSNDGAHEVAEDLRIAGLMVQSANREVLERRAGVTSRLVYAVPALLAEVERLTAAYDNALAASECNHLAKVEWFHRAEKAEAEAQQLREGIEALAAHWSSCWCGPQMAYDHDPRRQDCPQCGDEAAKYFAGGFVSTLRALPGGERP